MHFLKVFLTAWVCFVHATLANSSVAFTKWPTVVYAGKPSNVYWEGDNKTPATITLRKGSSDNLQTIKVLTTQARGGVFTWTPDSSLPEGTDYALQIDQNGGLNYSGHLAISHTPGKGPVAPTSKNTPFSTSPHGSMRTSTGKSNSGQLPAMNPSSSRAGPTSASSSVAVKKLTGTACIRFISTDLVMGVVAFIVYLTA